MNGMKSLDQNSRNIYAKLSGASIVLMAVLAAVAMGLVFQPIFESSNDSNFSVLQSVQDKFLLSVILWIGILICDLVASWSLYKTYEGKSRTKAMLMGAVRFVYSLVLAGAIVFLIKAQLLWSESSLADSASEIMDNILRFENIWSLGLVIFGGHLVLLSKLVCDKKLITKILAVLILLGGVGYILVHGMPLLVAISESSMALVEKLFMAPMILGEVGLGFLLLFKKS